MENTWKVLNDFNLHSTVKLQSIVSRQTSLLSLLIIKIWFYTHILCFEGFIFINMIQQHKMYAH